MDQELKAFSLKPLAFSAFQAVTVPRTVGDMFTESSEFFSEPGDVDVYRSLQYIAVFLPGFAQNIFPWKDPVGSFGHHTEYFEFFFG